MTLTDLYNQVDWSVFEEKHDELAEKGQSKTKSAIGFKRDPQKGDEVFLRRCDLLRWAMWGPEPEEDTPEEVQRDSIKQLLPVWEQVRIIAQREGLLHPLLTTDPEKT